MGPPNLDHITASTGLEHHKASEPVAKIWEIHGNSYIIFGEQVLDTLRKNIACFEYLHYGKTSTKKIQKVSRGAGSASGASKVTGWALQATSQTGDCQSVADSTSWALLLAFGSCVQIIANTVPYLPTHTRTHIHTHTYNIYIYIYYVCIMWYYIIIYRCIYTYIYTYIYIHIRLFISINLASYLSTYLPIYLSIYLSILSKLLVYSTLI